MPHSKSQCYSFISTPQLPEIYLRGCGAQIHDISRQYKVLSHLKTIGKKVRETAQNRRTVVLQELLVKYQAIFQVQFRVPTTPR